MRHGRTDRDWAVVAVMAFAAGAFFVWALMSNHPANMTEPVVVEWPAWVQAVGSIAAIFVAVAVPGWQRSQQRKDEQDKAGREARSMALFLLDAATEFRDLAEFNERVLASETASYNDGYHTSLPIPDDLQEVKRDLHLMGKSGSHILRALYYTSKFNTMRDHNKVLWRENFEEARRTLVIILEETNAALDGMNQLLK